MSPSKVLCFFLFQDFSQQLFSENFHSYSHLFLLFRVRVEYYVNENTFKERLQLYFIKNQRSSKYLIFRILDSRQKGNPWKQAKHTDILRAGCFLWDSRISNAIPFKKNIFYSSTVAGHKRMCCVPSDINPPNVSSLVLGLRIRIANLFFKLLTCALYIIRVVGDLDPTFSHW